MIPQKTEWQVEIPDDLTVKDVHVVPTLDNGRHLLRRDCWCCPKLQPGITFQLGLEITVDCPNPVIVVHSEA